MRVNNHGLIKNNGNEILKTFLFDIVKIVWQLYQPTSASNEAGCKPKTKLWTPSQPPHIIVPIQRNKDIRKESLGGSLQRVGFGYVIGKRRPYNFLK